MVENLILRIADQERRITIISQKTNNPVFDHYGTPVMTPKHDVSLNALAFNNLSTAPATAMVAAHKSAAVSRQTSYRESNNNSSLPSIQQTPIQSLGDKRGSLQEQVNYMRQRYR